MATAQEINIKIGATDNASAVFAKIVGNAKKMQFETGRSGSFADQIFGEDRGLRKFMQGGAVAFIGNSLAHATDGARRMTDEFIKGKASAQEMFEEIAKGLPVIGGFVKAGRDIRYMIDEIARSRRAANLEAQGVRGAELFRAKPTGVIEEEVAAQAKDLESRLTAFERATKTFGALDKEMKARARLAGLTGDALAAEQAKLHNEQSQEKIDEVSSNYLGLFGFKKSAMDRFEEMRAQAAKESADLIARIAQERADKEVDAETDLQEKINTIIAEGREARLRLMGDADQAELDQMKRSAEEKQREIIESAKRAARGLPADQADAIMRRARAEAAAIGQQSVSTLDATLDSMRRRSAGQAIRDSGRMFELIGNDSDRFTTGVQQQYQMASAMAATASNTATLPAILSALNRIDSKMSGDAGFSFT